MKLKHLLPQSIAIALTTSFIATAAPNASEDYYATDANSVLYIPASALLENDSDDNGNSIFVTTVDDPINGKTVYDKSTGLIQFTPAEDFTGSAFFTYAVGYDSVNNNDWENTGYATVTIDVGTTEPSNLNVPQSLINELIFEGAEIAAIPDNFTAQVNDTVTISVQQLTANDYSSFSSPLYVTVVGDAVNGQVSYDQENGSITFSPQENFIGDASFFYGIHHQVASNDWANMGFAQVSITFEQNQTTSVIDSTQLFATELELLYLIELEQLSDSTANSVTSYLDGFRFTPSRAIFPENTTAQAGRWIFPNGRSVSFATMSEVLGVLGYRGGWREEILRNFRRNINLGGELFDWTIALQASGFSQYTVNLPNQLESFIQSLTFTRDQVYTANAGEVNLDNLTADEQFVLYALGYFGGWRANPTSGNGEEGSPAIPGDDD